MAGPWRPVLLRGVVAGHAMPTIMRHPARAQGRFKVLLIMGSCWSAACPCRMQRSSGCSGDLPKSPGTAGASMCRQSAAICLIKSPTHAQRSASRVVARLTVLVDPRDRRGRRHSLVSMLLTACCAVLAGARSYVAVGQWAAQAPQDALATGPLCPAPGSGSRRRITSDSGTGVEVLGCCCGGGDRGGAGREVRSFVAAPGRAAASAGAGGGRCGTRTHTIPLAFTTSIAATRSSQGHCTK